MKYSEKLVERYSAEIGSWNWDRMRASAELTPREYGRGEYELREYIGGVLNLYPSGKIYAPWTTNQTARDVIRDEAFREALESVALDHGANIDFCDDDVFATWPHDDALADYRENDGTLKKWAWPGGYPVFYIGSKDGSVLCADCAGDSDNYCRYQPDTAEINYENTELYCDECGSHIESAYCENEE